MNADQLLEHFARISDAADAVPRLRRFVLDLAVRGKLLPQDPSEAISTPGATGQDLPFAIPSAWAAIPLGDALHMINGRAFKPTDWLPKGLPIVRIQNLNNATAPFNFCNPETVDGRHLIDDDEFLISWSGTPGTSFGAFIWRQGKAALNQHIFKCLPKTKLYADRFLQMAINGRLDEMIAKAHGGVGLQHITKGKLESLVLPVPPLAEQHRIVAKVDELMALCDRLEAAQGEREARRDRLVSASLARVIEPEGADATAATLPARFHLDNFARLTTRPEHVKQLRQTILNLAVRGRLVPQGNSDESATQLLTHLRASHDPRHRRVATDEGSPHEIPRSWVWACLEDLVVFGPQNGISPKPTESESAPKAITLTATTSGRFDDRYFKHVDVRVPENSEYWLSDGDLLFQRGNTREYVGIAAVYTGPPQTFLYPDLMIKVRLSPMVDLRYAHLAVTAPPARAYFGARATGAQASMPKINQTILLSLPFPLPPLAEQRRIVAKVDESMALCDQLEASLASAATDRARLLEALLHEALAPAA